MDTDVSYADLPTVVKESYFSGIIGKFEQHDCLTWTGSHRMPTRQGGARIPVIVNGKDVYDASKVGYALIHKTEYPLLWYQMQCRNLWCVNGRHVNLHRRGPTGRREKALPDTAHYIERRGLILARLSEEPRTTYEELFLLLQDAGIGGKSKTVSRIVSEVRQELGLPSRVVARRRAHV